MNNKEILQGVSKGKKIEFLNKLASGKYILRENFEPQPRLKFDLQPDGKYKCQQDGRIMTLKEIRYLRGYSFDRSIEIVSDRDQVNHKKLPDGFILMPLSKDEFLDYLLIGTTDPYPNLSDEELDKKISELERILELMGEEI